MLAGGCGQVGVDSKNNNNNKIIHENNTLNNVENIYKTKFLFSNLLMYYFLLQFSKHPNTNFKKQKTKNSHQTYPNILDLRNST